MLSEESYNSTLIMQLHQDNLTLWTSGLLICTIQTSRQKADKDDGADGAVANGRHTSGDFPCFSRNFTSVLSIIY
jgi:hypothetical protein